MELIVAADYSGPIKLDFADLAVPVVVLDNRKLDNLALAAASQTVVSGPVWIDASGQLTAERFMGNLLLHKDDVPDKSVTLVNPTTLDLNLGVKSFLGGLSYSPVYANVQGGSLLDGQTGDERRVAFIGFVDSFTYLNDAGLQAFDAGVKWSANLKPQAPEEPQQPKPVGSDPTTAANLEGSFLNEVWKIDKGKKEQGLNGEEQIQKGTKGTNAFLNIFADATKDLGLVNYQKKLLTAIKAMTELDPELKTYSSDVSFLDKTFDIGKLYYGLDKNVDAGKNSTLTFLSDINNAQTDSEIKSVASGLQSIVDEVGKAVEALRFGEKSSLNLAKSISLSGSGVNDFVQILEDSNQVKTILDSFDVYNAIANSENQMLFVSVRDNLILNNRDFPFGSSFSHTSPSGFAFPYYLVLRNGQLEYYPEGVDASIYPGDKVIIPTSAESDFPVLLLEDALIERVITPLLDLNSNLGEFVLGAVYQYIYNQGDFPRQLLSVSPEVRRWLEASEQEAEQALLDTAAFQAGRLFGDGAAVVTGVLEILGGFGLGATGGAAGASLCLTGIGCISGAPAIAVSVVGGAVLVVDGANTIRVGLENILEQIESTTFAAITGQGGLSQPKAGDPVPGIQGAVYGLPRGGGGRPADRAYAERVTGNNTGLGIYVERPPNQGIRVEFDGIDGKTLLDAKNWQRNGMYDLSPSGTAEAFIKEIGRNEALEQAQRQVTALPQSSATGIEWRIADETVADFIRDLLNEGGFGQIVVVHAP